MLHSWYVAQTMFKSNLLDYFSFSGFDKTKNFIILEKYLAEKSKILCTVMKGPESDTRLINIPLMDKILSQELV